jgi:hypothetical protein
VAREVSRLQKGRSKRSIGSGYVPGAHTDEVLSLQILGPQVLGAAGSTATPMG